MTMLLFVVVLCLVEVFSTTIRSTTPVIYDLEKAETYFEEFIKTYSKVYENELEKDLKFQIFKKNLEITNTMNFMENGTAVYGITQFFDMTDEEFKETYLTLLVDDKSPCVGISKNFSAVPKAPETFDWRQQGVITRVKNQQTCGSCWAFSITGNVEGQYAKKHGNLLEFSEQQLLDCDPNHNGCVSGYLTRGMMYLTQAGGIMNGREYPYEDAQRNCRFKPDAVRARVTNCYRFRLSSEDQLKEALYETGPISVGVCGDNMDKYQKGIFSHCCQGRVSHAVLLVGYGAEGGQPYWIIKNSWGLLFGENGYIRIPRGQNACNLMSSEIVTSEVA